jgi:branched-chain amino acid transport system substrate-binding protein
LAYVKAFKMQPDVYAVQGYDAGQLLLQCAEAVKGDLSNKKALYAAMEAAVIDSPRGKWTMSKAHNPVQDMYLREVKGKENIVLGVAAKALSDSGAGCKLV